jgi:hypothetical protein
MLSFIVGVSLLSVVVLLIGLVRSAYNVSTTTKSITDNLNGYRESKMNFRGSYVSDEEFWLSGFSIFDFIQRFTDNEIRYSGFYTRLFFEGLYETAITMRENNDYIKPEYITEINKILEAVDKITDNPDSRALLCSNDRAMRKIFRKLMFRVGKVQKKIKEDAQKRENQRAFAGRNAALEIVSHLDEEFDNKNPEIVFGQSGTGKTIPVHFDNNDLPVSANTTTLDAQNHVDGDEEEDLDNEDVWSLSENVDG